MLGFAPLAFLPLAFFSHVPLIISGGAGVVLPQNTGAATVSPDNSTVVLVRPSGASTVGAQSGAAIFSLTSGIVTPNGQ